MREGVRIYIITLTVIGSWTLLGPLKYFSGLLSILIISISITFFLYKLENRNSTLQELLNPTTELRLRSL